MGRISLILALGVLLGITAFGWPNAKAASAVSSPALALGQQIDALHQSNIVNADVGVRIYIGPRYRHYRRYRYRQYHHPRVYHRYYRGHRYGYGRRYGRCGYWSRRCAANWGYGGSNYRGCLKYHGCR